MEHLIFLEFTVLGWSPEGSRFYFVGKDKASVFEATKNGTSFDNVRLKDPREITYDIARTLHLQPLDLGIRLLQRGATSFQLKPQVRAS
jgi:hypothetical protein